MDVWNLLEYRTLCSSAGTLVLVLNPHFCCNAFCKHYIEALEEVRTALQCEIDGNWGSSFYR